MNSKKAVKCDLVRSSIQYHNNVQLGYYVDRLKKTMMPVDSYYVNRHIMEFLQFSQIKPGENILEVGCGMGKFTIPLLKKGFQITGLDLSPFLLQKLLEYNDNRFGVELMALDILEIPEEYNEKFDYVIGFFTLHHFQNLPAYFQAMKRVLKPNGKILFLEPNAFNPLYYFQIFFTPGMSWGGKGVAMMTENNFKKAAEYSELRFAGIKKYGFFPPFIVNKKWGRQLDDFVEKLPPFKPILAFQLIQFKKTQS